MNRYITNRQQSSEMMLDNISYLRNANQYHDMTHFTPSSVAKKRQIQITLEDVNKLEPTNIAGGNENCTAIF